METDTAVRLFLLYAHLLLCVAALHAVVSTDWRLLRGQISGPRLHRTHKQVSLSLAGLWLTGAGIVLIDLQGQFSAMSGNTKLMAKLACVSLLTVNACVLRWWSFPRLMGGRQFGRLEACALMGTGAISTTCWLMAGFYGIAKPIKALPLEHNLGMLGFALLVAVSVAVALSGRIRLGISVRCRPAAPILRG